MTADPRPTRYRFEVTCRDLGEYDSTFNGAVVAALAELVGAAGVHDFEIDARRIRPGEFS